MVGTWSERKDLINKIGYENIIGAWNSLFEVHDNWNRVADKYRVLYTRKA